MSDVQECAQEDADLRVKWGELFEIVTQSYLVSSDNGGGGSVSHLLSSGSSGSNHSSGKNLASKVAPAAATPAFCRDALIAGGYRPKCKLLNVLLDAVSLKLAELERKAESNVTLTKSLSTTQSVNQIAASSHNDTDADPQTTDDDDDDSFFKSPSLMSSYKLKAMDRKYKFMQSHSRLPPNPPVVMLDDRVSENVTSESLITSEKDSKNQNEMLDVGGTTKGDGELQNVSATSLEIQEVIDLSVQEAFPECSPIVSSDESPSSVKKDSGNNSKQNVNERATPVNGKSGFSFTLKKKKEAWVDPDTSTSKSQINFSKKRYKQMNLFSVTKNVPPKKVDITTLKEYNGGSWSTEAVATDCITNGTERKSDGNIESQEGKDTLECSSLSDTFFEVSPIKSETISPENINPTSCTKPISRRTVQSAKAKPLSPKMTNVANDKPTQPSTSKSNPTKRPKLDCTYDLMKDFDKIPIRGSPSPKFKFKEETVRKKADRAQLQGWDCEECRQYYEALESQMDEKEIARIKNSCSRHRSKAPVMNNTPLGFWDTKAPSTEELYSKGYINVASVAFTPVRRIRRINEDSD